MIKNNKYLTSKDLAHIYNVSVNGIAQMLKRGKLPKPAFFNKKAGGYFWNKSDFENTDKEKMKVLYNLFMRI